MLDGFFGLNWEEFLTSIFFLLLLLFLPLLLVLSLYGYPKAHGGDVCAQPAAGIIVLADPGKSLREYA